MISHNIVTDDPAFLLELREAASVPIAASLGLEILNCNLGLSTVHCRFNIGKEFSNRGGNVQGGILSALCDSTMTIAGLAATRLQATLPTLQMNISFLTPAPFGALDAVGRVQRIGKSIGYFAAELYRLDATLVAVASATARIVRHLHHNS